MIKPVFAQCSTDSGSVGPRLLTALEWWTEILHYGITECKAWVEPALKSCHLFVDAASTPPRCAAVLIMEGGTWYTEVEPPEAIAQRLLQGEPDARALAPNTTNARTLLEPQTSLYHRGTLLD